MESLTPIRPISERIRVWEQVSGRQIGFINLDLATEYDRLVAVLLELRPEAIVHFAEQRAAPYSMRTAKTKRYTVDNNVRATHNLLTALVDRGSTRRWRIWARWVSTGMAGRGPRRSRRGT